MTDEPIHVGSVAAAVAPRPGNREVSAGPGLSERAPPPGRPSEPPAEGRRGVGDLVTDEFWLRRLLVLVAGCVLLGRVYELFQLLTQIPLTGLLGLVVLLAVLGAVVGGLVARTERGFALPELVLVASAILVLGSAGIGHLAVNQRPPTDEGEFLQYAAHLLLRGTNPYTANMASVIPSYGTPLLTGGLVHRLQYPALGVLVLVPFVALDPNGNVVGRACLIFLLTSLLLCWNRAPAAARSSVVLLFCGVFGLVGLAVVGLGIFLALPFLVVASSGWDEMAEYGPGGRRWRCDARAICLGLGAAVNQLVWLVVPFLAVGVFLSLSRRLDCPASRRAMRRWLAFLCLGFLVPNAPFIIWDWHAWLGAVLGPLRQGAVPLGSGLVAVTNVLLHGSGALWALNVAALAALLILLSLFALSFPALRRAALVLPFLPLALASRSLPSYFVVFTPVWLVSFLTTRPLPSAEREPWHPGRLPRVLVLGGLSALLVGSLGLALLTPQPVGVRVVGYRPAGHGALVGTLVVDVENHSARPLTPHFEIVQTASSQPYWLVHQGPTVLPAGRSARYVLLAPDAQAAELPGVRCVLQVVTAKPETVSVAPCTVNATRGG